MYNLMAGINSIILLKIQFNSRTKRLSPYFCQQGWNGCASAYRVLSILIILYQNNFSEPYGIASLPNFAAMVIVAVL